MPRICKDSYDVQKCEQLIIKYYAQLKHIYISLISSDEYPNIGWLRFTTFCKDSKIIDADCPINVIDRCFIAANYEIEDMSENPDRSL